jgi:hypothetical protein
MRRSERLQVDIPVIWTRGERGISCIARDMNLHGFFLSTEETIAPGSLMQLNVALPDKTIALFGTSRFVGRTVAGHGIGVEVFLIDDESRSAWVSYYRSLSRNNAGSEAANWVDAVSR